MFKLRSPSNALVAISEIPSIVVSNDPKDGEILRNFLVNALVSDRVLPRNALGLRIHDYRKSFRVAESLVDDFARGIVEKQGKANPLTLAKRVTENEAQFIARNELERESRKLAREFALKGFLTTDDITRFLADDGIGCEWVRDSQERTQEPIQDDADKSSSKSEGVDAHPKKERRRALDDLIDEAVGLVGLDCVSIWPIFLQWAQSGKVPFVGLSDEGGGGIKYMGKRYELELECDILTKTALHERIRRRRKKINNSSLANVNPR